MRQLSLWSRGGPARAVVPHSDALPVGHVWGESALGAWLSEQVGKEVYVTFTNNRSTMMSYREGGAHIRLRLHRMFAEAGPTEVRALARYLDGGDRAAGRVLDAFIASRSPDFAQPVAVQPRGRFHQLDAMLDELNARYFHGACQARITWGSSGARRRRRSIQLGCYVAGEGVIRIHPCLDQAFVPHHYVAWIVFHEMLHEVFGVEGHGAGRRSLHPPEFVAIEESYPDYAACKAWEEANLHRLLRYRPPRNSAARKRS